MSSVEQKLDLFRNLKVEEFATACPSRTLEMALEDLEAAELNPRYKIDMGTWHEDFVSDPYGSPKTRVCEVCYAGSVMANRLGKDPTEDVSPNDFSDVRIRARLCALNAFQGGDIGDGVYQITGITAGIPQEVWDLEDKITPYYTDSKQFKADIRNLIAVLRKHDL